MGEGESEFGDGGAGMKVRGNRWWWCEDDDDCGGDGGFWTSRRKENTWLAITPDSDQIGTSAL
jgi:hypothetical protein